MVGSFSGEFGVSGAGGNIRKYSLLLETFLRNWWQMTSFTLPPVQSNYLILVYFRDSAETGSSAYRVCTNQRSPHMNTSLHVLGTMYTYPSQ